MENSLKIFFTLPYYLPVTEKEQYIQFLVFAEVAKNAGINFEMISFQDSPGRFLTETVVFEAMENTDDSIFPITVLNNKIIKTEALPTIDEFSKWFESLDQMSFEKLLAKQKDIDPPKFLSEEEFAKLCSESACASCFTTCSFRDSDLREIDFSEGLTFL